MKTGVYISPKAKKSFAGVDKKIEMQIRVLSEHYLMNHIFLEKEKTSLIKSFLWRMPLGSFGREYEKALIEMINIGQIDFFYIRHFLLDRRGLAFYKRIRKEYPDCKIIVELATYPYKGEVLHNKTMWPFYYKDRLRMKKVGKYIDCYAAVAWDQPIYGTPVIRISNGIIVDDIILSEEKRLKKGNEIHLLAVAQMQKHHGYERLINGLHEYYLNGGKRHVIIDFVGEGEEKDLYQRLTEKYQLGDSVIFHGKKNSEELMDFYREADIGLGSFGFYKISLSTSSVLKMREYLAYGLPVISGCIEDFIKEGEECKYYKQFPNDDSDVDINEIVSFYDALTKNMTKEILRKKIHEYAKKHVDMEVVMKPVLDYIEKATI